MNRNKWLGVGALLAIICLYVAIRITPLIVQNVGYTYDQGRDFLKAAEMVMDKKPTFLGPTTGINGLYHGAWWYYVLALPFVLFHGLPIGYYYFNLLLHLLSVVLLFLFIRKYFGLLPAFTFALLVTLSPYFIFTSLFVGNNIMVIPTMLCFLIVNFKIFEDKKAGNPVVLSILNGVLLGLIGEFELSFGLFLIPTYLLGMLLFKKLRSWNMRIPRLLGFLGGLAFVFIPRLLFEVKHGFEQTKILLSFFIKPKLIVPKPYPDVLKDRLDLFKGYFESLFPHTFITVTGLVFVIVALILLFKNRKPLYRQSLLFFSYILFTLFGLSTLYKDQFWKNYYEGIQFLIIFIILGLFYATYRRAGHVMLLLLCIMLAVYGLLTVPSDLKKTPPRDGLISMVEAVNHIVQNEKDPNNFCTRIYTPPIIPYTYDYLFLYQHISKKISLPQKEWVNNHCWFIVEKDDYKERQKIWTDANFPVEFVKRESTTFPNIEVIRYQLK